MKHNLFSFILIYSIFLGIKTSAQAVGFAPFLGITTSNIDLRAGPTTFYYVINKVQANSTVYIFSKNDYNGFINPSI